MAGRNASSLIWDTWNKDPTEMAVLRAIDACQARLNHYFGVDIGTALAQQYVCSYLSISIGRGGSALLNSFQLEPHLRVRLWKRFRRPVGDVAEEAQ